MLSLPSDLNLLFEIISLFCRYSELAVDMYASGAVKKKGYKMARFRGLLWLSLL